MIELFLCISVCLNVMFVFYSRWLIGILKNREEDVNELADVVYEYVTHVKSVHEMEMFYGDETLRNLLRHSKEIVNTFSSYDLEEDIEDFDDNSEA